MSNNQSRIEALASTICRAAAEINNHLVTEGLPALSFSVEAPPILVLPPHLQNTRAELLDATSELHDLVTGPLNHLIGLTNPTHNIIASLHFINHYQIGSKIEVGEDASYERLAQECGVPADDIRRILRFAAAFHIFEETPNGSIRHSAASRCMVDIPGVNDWIGHFCNEIWPSSCKTVEALSRWKASDEPDETAFALTNITNQSLFEFLQERPINAERFTRCMKFLQNAPEFSVFHLLKDLQWEAESCPKCLVDIGGADGSIATAILRNFPSMNAVVQDQPNVVEAASVPKDLEGRLQFMSHDMFSPQPVEDADVYFLRSTFHDWSDKYCITILRNLIPALKEGAKVIINDVCMPSPNLLPFSQEQLLRGYDLVMKQLFNSKERDAKEWEALFSAADPRFQLQQITCSPGSILAVIEATWNTTRET